MKKPTSLYWLTIFALVGTNSSAQMSASMQEVLNLGLPVISVTTVDGALPTGDFVFAPEGPGYMGATIINENKVPCQVKIIDGQEVVFDSGEYAKDSSGATIKISGNTSNMGAIKSYKLKYQKKTDMLLRGDSAYRDKNWRLLSAKNSVKLNASYKISKLLGMEWTPAYTFCNLMINDSLAGTYILIESVEKNSDCRIKVNKKRGMIIERDPYWWAESKSFASPLYADDYAYRWTYKYPDNKDVTDSITNVVSHMISVAENTIIPMKGDYTSYFDAKSMASWLLCHDIIGTWDAGGSNMYFAKHDDSDTTKWRMPVVWDFDTSFNEDIISCFSPLHNNDKAYFIYLFYHEDRTFAKEYRRLWEQNKDSVREMYQELFLDNNPDLCEKIQNSYNLTAKRNDIDTIDVFNQCDIYREWLTQHLDWMENEIYDFYVDCPLTKAAFIEDEKYVIYDMLGRQLPTLQEGFNIVRFRSGKVIKFYKK